LRKLLALLAFSAAFVVSAPAHAEPDLSCNAGQISVPEDLRIVCSNTWQLSGTCNAKDMWDQWQITGEPKPEDAFIRPWTPAPIRVIGYELVKLQGGDNRVWQPASIAISAGARELSQALRTISVVARDLFTLNWGAIRADQAAGFEKIAAIQKEADEKIGLARYYSNDRQSWFMVGSGIHSQADAMIWLAPGEMHSLRMWPAGAGQIWPGKAGAIHSKYEDILDLHGICFGGGPVTIFLTIYYTPLRGTPSSVAEPNPHAASASGR
jgi:hypothetical protein